MLPGIYSYCNNINVEYKIDNLNYDLLFKDFKRPICPGCSLSPVISCNAISSRPVTSQLSKLIAWFMKGKCGMARKPHKR